MDGDASRTTSPTTGVVRAAPTANADGRDIIGGDGSTASPYFRGGWSTVRPGRTRAVRAIVTCDDAVVRRRLVIVRHAKSSWDDSTLSDRERPLAPRGLGALGPMRDHLAASVARPDLVLCSPARRTVDTLAGIVPALPDGVRVEQLDALYGADAATLLRIVRSLDDEIACAMFVGHNPGLGDLAVLLAGSGERAARDQLREKFPTGAIATLSVDSGWADLEPGAARLDDLFMPRRPRS